MGEQPHDARNIRTRNQQRLYKITECQSNLMMRETSEQEISSACTKSLSAISQRNGKTIVISNEVGLGVIPETALGREYREILGRVNQQWARAARQSLFLIAGKAFPLHDPQEILQ